MSGQKWGSQNGSPVRKKTPKQPPPPLDLTQSPERVDRTAPRNFILLMLALVWLGSLTVAFVVYANFHSCVPPLSPPPPPPVRRDKSEEVRFNLTAASPKTFEVAFRTRREPSASLSYSVCCHLDGLLECGQAAGVAVRLVWPNQLLHITVIAARETQCVVSIRD